MRSLLTITLLALSILFVGCAENPMAPKVEEDVSLRNVTIQLYGAREWKATVHTVDMGIDIDRIKPMYDTTAFNLGMYHKGATLTMKTGIGRYEFFKTPDSIKVIMGHDTIITYGIEGLEKVYTVK